jgi:ferredoxin
MKKLIFGTLFLALVGIGGFSCKKNHEIKTLSKTENTFESQKNELQNILKDLNSEEKDGPGWWEKFKDWVHTKSGTSQRWVNGQAACFGDGGCGPCAGMCPFGLVEGGDVGNISDSELSAGFRPLLFTFVENSEKEIRLIVEIPNSYKSDFVTNNGVYVAEDTYLPAFLVAPIKANTILIKKGFYPAIIDSVSGNAQTIVDIIIN